MSPELVALALRKQRLQIRSAEQREAADNSTQYPTAIPLPEGRKLIFQLGDQVVVAVDGEHAEVAAINQHRQIKHW